MKGTAGMAGIGTYNACLSIYRKISKNEIFLASRNSRNIFIAAYYNRKTVSGINIAASVPRSKKKKKKCK